MTLSKTQFHIHSFRDKHRAEFCCEGGFILIEAGDWKDTLEEAESDRNAMIKREMEKAGHNQPEIEFF